jgi:hypothetical protein
MAGSTQRKRFYFRECSTVYNRRDTAPQRTIKRATDFVKSYLRLSERTKALNLGLRHLSVPGLEFVHFTALIAVKFEFPDDTNVNFKTPVILIIC